MVHEGARPPVQPRDSDAGGLPLGPHGADRRGRQAAAGGVGEGGGLGEEQVVRVGRLRHGKSMRSWLIFG